MDVGGGDGCFGRSIPERDAVRRAHRQQDAQDRLDMGGNHPGGICVRQLADRNVMIALHRI